MLAMVTGLAACCAAAASHPARADESSQILARAAVEAERYEADRQKTRIEWPEIADAPPPDGAEAWIVEGYIEYRVTRIVRHGDRVEGRTVAMCRNWFYGADERFDAEAFEVPLGAFSTAWNAARRVDGAKLVRIVEPPEPLGGRFGSGSHESSLWVRLRDGTGGEPWHASVARGWHGDADEVRSWSDVRDRAVFHLVANLVPTTGRRPAPFAEWGPWFTAEIARTTPVRESFARIAALLDRCVNDETLRSAAGMSDADVTIARERLHDATASPPPK